MADLDACRKRLLNALRDKGSKYWELMKNWYKRRISKDEFDAKAKSFLGEEGIQFHNDFLFAILVKCQGGPLQDRTVHDLEYKNRMEISEEARIAKQDIQVRNLTPYGTFSSISAYDVMATSNVICGEELDRLLLCSHELLLPDYSTLQIRMLLGSWESGLEEVSQDAVNYMMLAIEVSGKCCQIIIILNFLVFFKNVYISLCY